MHLVLPNLLATVGRKLEAITHYVDRRIVILQKVRPFGLASGESGELGENAVRRADGRIEKLQGCDATTIEADGTIIIKTPTGGGYGEPAK